MSKNAFATIHFGNNPVYLELELYFFRMLQKYTKNDILYLFSINDTPSSFVDAVRPLVHSVIPYDDRGITYDVKFESGYSNFNTLRTCNFIFAYTLEKYDKICIIESDMVIMGNLDSIFNLNAPAVLTYYIGEKQLKTNARIQNTQEEVIAKCKDMGRTNGGVMLIEPSKRLFKTYKEKIQDVVKYTCKYPNETLFEYVNNSYFNMPIQYNLSHFLAKPHIIAKYGLTKDEILVFHFNETKFKHIDIIKAPIDESGINWLENSDPKYAIKKNAVLHYKDTVYDKHPEIGKIISKLLEKKSNDIIRMSSKEEEEEKEDKKKGIKLIQESIANVEEKGDDFGALLQQMKKYQPAFDKLPKSTQDKLNKMNLKDMVKKMKELDEKNKKWIDRIKDLIDRISVIQTKAGLEKFHTNYVEPILKMEKKENLNELIKEHIQILTNAYDSQMRMVLLENPEKTGRHDKWINRINKLIERIPAIQTKPSLEQFHTNYIQPILEINKKEILNEIIQEHIKLLTNAYDSQMKMINLEKETEEVVAPNLPSTPPPQEFLRVFGKEEYDKVYPKPKSPSTPQSQEFLRVFGKEEYDKVYPKPKSQEAYKKSPTKRKLKKTQKCKDDEELNPESGRCRKKCPEGKVRNEKGNCVKNANKTKKVKKCKDDEELNPESGRCRKKCPEGKVRNEKGNCVNKPKK
jgi:hypothetical protein